MKKYIGKFLIILGWILLIIAAIIVIRDYIEVHKAYSTSESVMKKVEEVMNKDDEDNRKVKISGNNYVGIVEIPSLNIKLPVLDECNDVNLKISPCRYNGDVYSDDKIVLAAHNYPKFFGNIKYLNEGDIVFFTALNNVQYVYKVDKIETLAGDDVIGMIDTKYELSLFSCNLEKDKRVTVRCIKQ